MLTGVASAVGGRTLLPWTRHAAYLKGFIGRQSHADLAEQLGLSARLRWVEERLAEASAASYLDRLHGTIGADPMGQGAAKTTLGARG